MKSVLLKFGPSRVTTDVENQINYQLDSLTFYSNKMSQYCLNLIFFYYWKSQKQLFLVKWLGWKVSLSFFEEKKNHSG